jgi:hypothetical protein
MSRPGFEISSTGIQIYRVSSTPACSSCLLKLHLGLQIMPKRHTSELADEMFGCFINFSVA